MKSPVEHLKNATSATVEITAGWMLSLSVIFAEYLCLLKDHKGPMIVITLFTLYSWAMGVFHLKDFVDIIVSLKNLIPFIGS